MPAFPSWPSQVNIETWCKERIRLERIGVDLLLEHYSGKQYPRNDAEMIKATFERRAVNVSSLQSENDKLRAIVLALAADHVPFFKPRVKKQVAWDSHVLARLLRDCQAAIMRGYKPRLARSHAGGKLPAKLRVQDKAIRNRLTQARKKFSNVVTVAPDGQIQPIGDFEARIWKYHLNGPGSSSQNFTVELDPHDPEAILVAIE